MIKALLLDGDGVTLNRLAYFSERYAKEKNVDPEKLRPFFREKFNLCQTGKADLKQELQAYIKDWGWKETVEEFLAYWFVSDYKPNQEVLDLVKQAQSKGVKCYLLSDQEKYRAEYLETVKFTDNFDGVFFSYSIGHQKSDSEFYEFVMKQLNLKYDEIVAFDDEQENVTVALEAGLNSKLYKYEELLKFVSVLK